MRGRFETLLVASVAALLVVPAIACKVPVFRYALERWQADDYQAKIFFRNDAATQVEILIKSLSRATHTNLEVEQVNLDTLTDAQLWEYDDIDGLGDEPVLRLMFPLSTKQGTPLWEGELDEGTISQVLDSPLRRKLVDSILSGASTTWVMIETGDAAADDAFEVKLKGLLRQQEQSLSIPDGVIAAEELTAEGLAADGSPIEMDDVLRTQIPLKIAFPVLRVSASDEHEQIFLKMLASISGVSLTALSEPLAIPVFGRGRCMPGIPASRLSEQSLSSACDYLCGECSCQVKDQNPGVDLLLNVDWSEKLQDSYAIVEKELPPLTGLGVAAAASPPETAEGDLSELQMKTVGPGKSSFASAILFTLSGLGIVVATITFLFVVKKRS